MQPLKILKGEELDNAREEARSWYPDLVEDEALRQYIFYAEIKGVFFTNKSGDRCVIGYSECCPVLLAT